MLIVEDGTGLADAESYVSVVDFTLYCERRRLTLTASDEDIEAALLAATSYIDSIQRYKAVRVSADQALEFPRVGLTGFDGLPIVGIHRRVKDACCDLAFKVISGEELYADVDPGIASETVGPLTTVYTAGGAQSKRFSGAMMLLAPFAYDARNQPGPPVFGGALTGAFKFGMHADPQPEPDS